MGERPDIKDVDAELARVGEATDGLVRAAQELRASLDALSGSVRAVVREAAERPEPEPAVPASEPSEAARIVALNMALDGKPRDEVAARLRDEFGLADADPLLDDVYARVG
jgi:hypothetical protein